MTVNAAPQQFRTLFLSDFHLGTRGCQVRPLLNFLQNHDAETIYLVGDILTKVDRASMAVSLEARVPLLDHRVVALAWSFPQRWRIRRGVSKAPLRDLLERRVPRALFERPKSGFGIPIGEWLRGPLRPWAEDLLSAQRLRRNQALDVTSVQRLWASHLAGRVNAAQQLWSLLMFEAWLDASDSTQWH